METGWFKAYLVVGLGICLLYGVAAIAGWRPLGDIEFDSGSSHGRSYGGSWGGGK